MCKRIFKFELQLSSYWQNIKSLRYCPKFHILTKIVIFKYICNFLDFLELLDTPTVITVENKKKYLTPRKKQNKTKKYNTKQNKTKHKTNKQTKTKQNKTSVLRAEGPSK